MNTGRFNSEGKCRGEDGEIKDRRTIVISGACDLNFAAPVMTRGQATVLSQKGRDIYVTLQGTQ